MLVGTVVGIVVGSQIGVQVADIAVGTVVGSQLGVQVVDIDVGTVEGPQLAVQVVDIVDILGMVVVAVAGTAPAVVPVDTLAGSSLAEALPDKLGA